LALFNVGAPVQAKHEPKPYSTSVYFLADRTNDRAYATLLRLSSVCDVMYCG